MNYTAPMIGQPKDAWYLVYDLEAMLRGRAVTGREMDFIRRSDPMRSMRCNAMQCDVDREVA